eukprot:Polyplicarium_translucidae@DN2045_c0_g1_i2.p1
MLPRSMTSGQVLSRPEFLSALHDDGDRRLSPALRGAWKELYRAAPLATYLVGRLQFTMPPKVPPLWGLMSLASDLILRIGQFLGHQGFYGRLCNVSRHASAFSSRPLASIELRAQVLYVSAEQRPTPKCLYRIYWMTEKLLAVRGHYFVLVQDNNEASCIATNMPLVTAADIDWQYELEEIVHPPMRIDVTFIRSLTIPSAAHFFSVVNTLPGHPKPPEIDGASVLNSFLESQLECPNLVELYAIDIEDKIVPGAEAFIERHRETLKVFVAPTRKDYMAGRLGWASGDTFQGLHHLRAWQHVEGCQVTELCSSWPRGFMESGGPVNGAESVLAVGFACEIEEEMSYFVSVPESLAFMDVVDSIRALVIYDKPACQVLAKVGELRIRLFFLYVGSCSGDEPCPTFCQMKGPEIALGLKGTDSLTVGGSDTNPPTVCSFVEILLDDGSFMEWKESAWGREHHVHSRREIARSLEDDRSAAFCDALVQQLYDSGIRHEQRIRAWAPVQSACDHHKVLRAITECTRDEVRWFARDCKCNVSWKFRCLCPAHAAYAKDMSQVEISGKTLCQEIVTFRSAEDQTDTQRKNFEHHFAKAECHETGLLEEMEDWVRLNFCASADTTRTPPKPSRTFGKLDAHGLV